MNFLSPAQCRAARGLLDWSQPDLAKRCSVHVQTISAFESETSTPTKTTLEKITKSFEKQGINFTETGIEKSESPVFVIRGKTHEDTYLQLLEDAYEQLKGKKNSELLLCMLMIKCHHLRLTKCIVKCAKMVSRCDNL